DDDVVADEDRAGPAGFQASEEGEAPSHPDPRPSEQLPEAPERPCRPSPQPPPPPPEPQALLLLALRLDRDGQGSEGQGEKLLQWTPPPTAVRLHATGRKLCTGAGNHKRNHWPAVQGSTPPPRCVHPGASAPAVASPSMARSDPDRGRQRAMKAWHAGVVVVAAVAVAVACGKESGGGSSGG